MRVSEFVSVRDPTPNLRDLEWSAFVASVVNPPEYPTKEACPLIKLAVFGDTQSARGSLRHDSNVLWVSGLEGDYDGEELPPEAGRLLLDMAGVQGVIHTTPSHTSERPRWRVLAPLSVEHPPADRAELMARLNDVLGGQLAPESFTLSQVFYWGRVAGVPYAAYAVDGEPIDLIPNLPERCPPAAFNGQGSFNAPAVPALDVFEDLRSALAAMPADDRAEWIAVGHALVDLGETGFQLWAEWSAKSPKHKPEDLTLWQSFAGERSGHAAVFAKAQRLGWQNPQRGAAAALVFGGSPLPPGANVEVGTIVDFAAPGNPFEALPHFVAQWIPQEEVALLSGHGGSGKSYVALSIAVHVALGHPFGPLQTTRANVLFYSAEDGARVLRLRLAKLCRQLGIEPATLVGKLILLDASDIDPALFRKAQLPTLNRLAALAAEHNAGLVVIDNASDAFDGDEIRRAEVRGFIRCLRSHLARPGRAVLLLAHINKVSATGGKSAGTEDYSGSTAWHNSVRSRMSLNPEDDDFLTIDHKKANHGPRANPVRLQWREGAPMVVTVDYRAEAARKDNHKAALVACVRKIESRGDHVSTAKSGPCTAFAAMRACAEFPEGLTKTVFNGLMGELQDAGSIVRNLIPTLNRKKREIFTCTSAA